MMNLQQAIEYGKRIGVKYYIKNQYGNLIAGTTTLADAKKKLAEKTKEGCFGILHIEKIGNGRG